MKRIMAFLFLLALFPLVTGCEGGHPTESNTSLANESSSEVTEHSQPETESSQPQATDEASQPEPSSKEDVPVKIQIAVGDATLTAVPEENPSADAFLALLQEGPITVQMSDYGGMEKVGPLGTDLPRSDSQIHVDAGDVILYQGNQITIYYGTNSWNFTKLATIEGATKESLLDVLGHGDVVVTFSLAE